MIVVVGGSGSILVAAANMVGRREPLKLVARRTRVFGIEDEGPAVEKRYKRKLALPGDLQCVTTHIITKLHHDTNLKNSSQETLMTEWIHSPKSVYCWKLTYMSKAYFL